MTYLRSFDDLISKINNKINNYQEGNKVITKKEVEEFINFLLNSDWDEIEEIFMLKKQLNMFTKKSFRC